MNSAYPRARSVLPTDYTKGVDSGNSTARTFGSSLETNFGGNGALPRNGSSSGRGGGAPNGGHPLGYTYSPLDYSSSSWQQKPQGLVDAGGESVGGAGGALGGGGGGGAIGGKQSKTYRLAVKRTMASIALSCCFGLATMLFRGQQSGLEFFAGYLVEQSLS